MHSTVTRRARTRRRLVAVFALALLLPATGCPRKNATRTPADRAGPRTPPVKRMTRMTPENMRGVFSHFQPELRVFHWGNTYLAALAALLAYEHQDEQTQRILRAMGFDRVAYVSDGTTQGFVASNEKMVLIAFRGTEVNKWGDIKADGTLCQRKGLGGMVHTGFANALQVVWMELMAAVRAQGKAGDAYKPIWVTGHSLGGALAMLASVRLDRAGVGVRGTVTLGQPRVGDLTFSRAYPGRERVYRITNQGDPVTVVPLRAQWSTIAKNKKCPFRYLHVGVAREFRKARPVWKPVLVTPVEKTGAKAGESKLKWMARTVGAFFRKMSSMFTVTRHMMPAYLRNIWGQVTPRMQKLLPPASSF